MKFNFFNNSNSFSAKTMVADKLNGFSIRKDKIMIELDELQKEVSRALTLEQSAIDLLLELKGKLDAANANVLLTPNPNILINLNSTLKVQNDALLNAITPVTPVIPATPVIPV